MLEEALVRYCAPTLAGLIAFFSSLQYSHSKATHATTDMTIAAAASRNTPRSIQRFTGWPRRRRAARRRCRSGGT